MREVVQGYDRPDERVRKPNYSILRVTATRKELVVIPLSVKIFWTKTHYNGSTTPCGDPEFPCRFCEAGTAPRWLGYFAAWDPRQDRKVCMEVTPAVADEFERYAQLCGGSIRGSEAKFSRQGERRNGRLLVKIDTLSATDISRIPEGFDVSLCLERLWQVRRPSGAAIGEIDQEKAA